MKAAGIRLILASGSPRRAELIQKVAAQLPDATVQIMPSNAPEVTLKGEPCEASAVLNARNKALEAASRSDGDAVVLGFDTVVALDGSLFTKPKDRRDAERMLRVLCGQTHEVVTGVCLISRGKTFSFFEKTFGTFAPYNPAVIDPYIASGASLDKAGGYGIQDEAFQPMVTEVRGDYDNVVGLPVASVVRNLKKFLKHE
jgi:septum formation protein